MHFNPPFNPGFFGRWRLKLSAAWAWHVPCAGLASGLRLCAALLLGLSLGVSLTLWPRPAQAATPVPMSAVELAMLDAINRYRRAQGRAPWQPEPALAHVARQHSRAMAVQGRLGHDGFQRRAAGTGTDLCVENLLRGHVAPDRAVQLWTQSAAHHDNLLEPAARHAGIGVAGAFVTLLACDSPPVLAGRPENQEGPSTRR